MGQIGCEKIKSFLKLSSNNEVCIFLGDWQNSGYGKSSVKLKVPQSNVCLAVIVSPAFVFEV